MPRSVESSLYELRVASKVTVREKFGVILSMSSITDRLAHFAASRCAVLLDDAGNGRAVIIAPADEISETLVNDIITLSGGLTFVALSPERASAFLLSSMARSHGDNIAIGHQSLPLYTSVEARSGVTTGISAADRATTLRILGERFPQPRLLVRPGHIFPVETKTGGVLVRAAIPEASLDIVKMAGFTDATLFMDLLDRDGELLDPHGARSLAATRNLALFSISELIQYRLSREPLISRVAEAIIPTKQAGELRAIVYRSALHEVEHIAYVKGEISSEEPVLVRVQSENTLADVFGGEHPASRKYLHNSLHAIGERGRGIVLYLRKPLLVDSDSLSSEQPVAPPPTAQMREYGIGAQILRDLGVGQIELLSSTNRALIGLSNFGFSVTRQIAIPGNQNSVEKNS